MKEITQIKQWNIDRDGHDFSYWLSVLIEEGYIIDSMIPTKYYHSSTSEVYIIVDAVIVCHKDSPDYGKC